MSAYHYYNREQPMMERIQIVAVSSGGGTDRVVHKIRKWCVRSHDPLVSTLSPQVSKAINLDTAISTIAASTNTSKTILVPIGFNESEVTDYVSRVNGGNLEVIIRPPRPGLNVERNDLPSSSLLEQARLVNVQDTIPAIRKSLLRLTLGEDIHFSYLSTHEQLVSYFKLRYRVWKDLGYLATDRDCSKSGLEVDYTDESAIPIGAFNQDNELIGCARLVFARKEDITDSPGYDRMILDLIKDHNDCCLEGNYQRPKAIIHPFVILEGFEKFQRFYRLLVRHRIPKAEIGRVIVEPGYRKRGLGEVLVDTLVCVARKQHLDMLFLACHEQHKGFYQRSGFHPLPGLWADHFLSARNPSIAMACNLRKHPPPVIH